jgi:mannose-6-phosphate isomerase-like protein (cupin superfamily)
MADVDQPRVGEATLERSDGGLRPVGEGWFVVNVAELAARRNERMGITCSPEPEDARFREFGFRLRVLEPGQFNARYHRENDQEAFLVLSGECVLIVEGQERLLRSGDFFHSPPLTGHVFVGAGDGPVHDRDGGWTPRRSGARTRASRSTPSPLVTTPA